MIYMGLFHEKDRPYLKRKSCGVSSIHTVDANGLHETSPETDHLSDIHTSP